MTVTTTTQQRPIPVAGLSEACWHCGFKSHRRHESLSFVSVLCRQVEVSATGWSLVWKNPTEYGVYVCECDREASTMALAHQGYRAARENKAQ
jgi:hypothetical protein